MGYVRFADQLSSWVGKAFAWCIVAMAIGVCYEVVVRYVFNAPTSWSFDISYMMYGTLFMMAGAYALSRGNHVRADFLYRLLKPRTQAKLDLVLYFIFFFPGILALIFAGWSYAARAWRFGEVSTFSPARIPIYQFKTIIVVAGILLLIQGIAQVIRCIICIRSGEWPPLPVDVEETEKLLMERKSLGVLEHGAEAVDVVLPEPEHKPQANVAAKDDIR